MKVGVLMKIKRIFLVLLAGLLLFMLGCSSTKQLRPEIALPGGHEDLEWELLNIDDIPFPDEEYAFIYKQTVPLLKDIKGTISKVIGADLTSYEEAVFPDTEDYRHNVGYLSKNGGSVSIDSLTGYWTYHSDSRDIELDALLNDENLRYEFAPDEELSKMAEEFVRVIGIYDGEFSNVIITDNYTGYGETARTIYKDVYLYPSVDGKNVYGIFRIMVEINSENQIKSLFCLTNNVKQYEQVKLKTKNDIIEDIKNGNFSPGIPEPLTNAVINGCYLTYYADAVVHSGKTYIYPIYTLIGEGINEREEIVEFSLMIDAIK